MWTKEELISTLKITTYIILIFMLIIGIYNYNQYENNIFKVNNINVKGNNYISTNEIINVIDMDKVKSVFDSDINAIKNNIENIPFIKSAYIKIELPNQLHIQIIEQIPIALIVHENKKNFIDYENNLLPANSKSINNFPVPILNIKKTKTNESNSISVIKYLYKNYNSMYDNISEISESKSKLTIITDKRTEIFLNPDMTINNLNKLKKFEESIKFIKEINDYKYIDLKFDNQVVVKEKIYS